MFWIVLTQSPTQNDEHEPRAKAFHSHHLSIGQLTLAYQPVQINKALHHQQWQKGTVKLLSKH